MKRVLLETKNVKHAQTMCKRMLSKKGEDLTLIYGRPGTGKSHFAKSVFAQNGWGYYRIATMDTARSFLRGIHRLLSFELYQSESISSNYTSELARQVIEMLQDLGRVRDREGRQYVLVIDEVNLAIQNSQWKILEQIREFRDVALSKVIMIGEEDTKDRIKRYNNHFFSRCSNTVAFEIVSREEMQDIVVRTSEVSIDKDLLSWIIKKCDGNMHDLEGMIKDIEAIGKSLSVDKVGLNEMRSVVGA